MTALNEADAKMRVKGIKKSKRLDAALITACRFCDLLLARALLIQEPIQNARDFNSQSLLGHAILVIFSKLLIYC